MKFVPTQAKINEESFASLHNAERALNDLLSAASSSHPSWPMFLETQKLWGLFADRQARERAGYIEPMPGTIASSTYAAEKEALIRARLLELEAYFSRIGVLSSKDESTQDGV